MKGRNKRRKRILKVFPAVKASASRYSLFWPGFLRALISSASCPQGEPSGWRRASTLPAAAQLRESLRADGADAAQFFPPCISLLSFSFLPTLILILSAGGGRATWTSTCSKNKLNSPCNYFLSLGTSNLSSPQADGNCCCTAGLARVKPAAAWRAGGMLFGSPAAQKSRQKAMPIGWGEHDLEALPAGQLAVYQREI